MGVSEKGLVTVRGRCHGPFLWALATSFRFHVFFLSDVGGMGLKNGKTMAKTFQDYRLTYTTS